MPFNLNFDAVLASLETKNKIEAAFGFAITYVACELLSIPPLPLVMFAGATFGVSRGVPLVLLCGVLSASISFAVGRRFRQTFRSWLKARPSMDETFQTTDKIITKGGFRALLLIRLVPTPLPCLNYLFGVTGVNPVSYLAATALGYAPGTLGIVYSGAFGKALLTGGVNQPWYIYFGACILIAGLAKLVGNVASSTFEALKADE